MFTELIEKLGVKGAQFTELLSIDAESLAQVQPLYGLIFLFKYRASEIKQRKLQQQAAAAGADLGGEPEGSAGGVYDREEGATDGKRVFFAHQRVQNACATQAVLSLLLNLKNTGAGQNEGEGDVDLGNTLTDFAEFVDSFDAELKGDAIHNSDAIRAVHNSFSRPNPFIDEDDQDDDRDRDEDSDGLYHFIAYLPAHNRLYELDGLHAHPITHGGACSFAEFPDRVAEVLRRRVESTRAGEMRFALMALTKDPRPAMQEMGDEEGLARETAVREEWHRENVLRRENFVGLISGLAKSVSAGMSDAEWQEQVLDKGRQVSQRRLAERGRRTAA